MSKQLDKVWALIAYGYSNSEIARDLSLSQKTVKAHATKLFQTLGVRNRTQAAILFHVPAFVPPQKDPVRLARIVSEAQQAVTKGLSNAS
jgi:predicted DNA-binding transcriptional regulator